jgi:hypothetical protein
MKHRSTSTRPHGAITRKAVTFILAAIRSGKLSQELFISTGNQQAEVREWEEYCNYMK